MKPKLIFIVSLPRSGTNHFCDQLERTKVGAAGVVSYREVFNACYYNGKWGTFYETYGASTKPGTLKAILDREHRRGRAVAIKIFHDQALPAQDLDRIREWADVRFLFLRRRLDEVYTSYYKAVTQNDWCSRRSSPLAILPEATLRSNPIVRAAIDKDLFRKHMSWHAQYLDARGVPYTTLHFDSYKHWSARDFQSCVDGLWSAHNRRPKKVGPGEKEWPT